MKKIYILFTICYVIDQCQSYASHSSLRLWDDCNPPFDGSPTSIPTVSPRDYDLRVAVLRNLTPPQLPRIYEEHTKEPHYIPKETYTTMDGIMNDLLNLQAQLFNKDLNRNTRKFVVKKSEKLYKEFSQQFHAYIDLLKNYIYIYEKEMYEYKTFVPDERPRDLKKIQEVMDKIHSNHMNLKHM